MDDLRWALLGLGILFLAGLAWWELRTPRHAAGDSDSDSLGAASARGSASTDFELPTVRRVEPHFGDPPPMRDIPDDVPTVHALELDAAPPVLLVDDLRAVEDPHGIVIASDVAIDTPAQAARSGVRGGPPVAETFVESASAEQASPAPIPPPAAVTPASASEPRPPPEPEWPPESERQIVSVRVVPRPPNRFPGRALRQAFLACGLHHGAMEIFHLEDEEGRVCASAANLMRPGTFNLDTMDGSHFHGVNLFCVLPGPLPPERAVDELIALSRDLSQRLNGIVLDQVGQPLDEQGESRLRDSLGRGPEV